MKNTFNYFYCINKIINCSPRQLEGEKRTKDVLKEILEANGLLYFDQKFSLNIPRINKAYLKVDGVQLEDIQGCSFVGGKIIGKENILSSLIPSAHFIDKENINFNPMCEGVSVGNHYFAPAIALGHDGLQKVLNGKKIQGEVKVEKIKHSAVNILVGNRKNPKVICFAHYDSINMGAIDNASGVALILKIAIKEKILLEDVLLVFSAAEELSFDYPVYWGQGFRVFEKQYLKIMQKAKKIIVVDCVGNGKAVCISEEKFLRLGFPILNIMTLSKKIILISADYTKLMTVYHSNLDDGRTMTEKHMDSAYKLLKQQMLMNI